MMRDYALELIWTEAGSEASDRPQRYDRNHQIHIAGKPVLEASADRLFHGDATRHNPEDLLLAALASCHMLSYLYLAAREGLRIRDYRDQASGRLRVDGESGRFVEVCLRPMLRLAPGSDPEQADALHHEAQKLCFIAHSVNFPVRIEAQTTIDSF